MMGFNLLTGGYQFAAECLVCLALGIIRFRVCNCRILLTLSVEEGKKSRRSSLMLPVQDEMTTEVHKCSFSLT